MSRAFKVLVANSKYCQMICLLLSLLAILSEFLTTYGNFGIIGFNCASLEWVLFVFHHYNVSLPIYCLIRLFYHREFSKLNDDLLLKSITWFICPILPACIPCHSYTKNYFLFLSLLKP